MSCGCFSAGTQRSTKGVGTCGGCGNPADVLQSAGDRAYLPSGKYVSDASYLCRRCILYASRGDSATIRKLHDAQMARTGLSKPFCVLARSVPAVPVIPAGKDLKHAVVRMSSPLDDLRDRRNRRLATLDVMSKSSATPAWFKERIATVSKRDIPMPPSEHCSVAETSAEQVARYTRTIAICDRLITEHAKAI